MSFLDRLQKLPEGERATVIKQVVEEGIKTEFGEWVLTHFSEALDEHYQALLRVTDPPELSRIVAGLQTVERLRAQIFEVVTGTGEHDD